MRFFDTLDVPCKKNIMTKAVAFAKGENVELGNDPMNNIDELTMDYCHHFECFIPDIYDNVDDVAGVPAWVGPRPVKVPR